MDIAPSLSPNPAGLKGMGTEFFERGLKAYELTNHLGNVLVTVSDRKIAVDANTDGTVDYYNADVINAQDYYAFGMLMPGRTYTKPGLGAYRYGFNGKENDNDVKGEGNQQDYGMRIYDPRLGRFLSVDPLTHDYPWYSPYHFAGNSPIKNIDLDGGEPKDMVKNWITRTMTVNDSRSSTQEVEWDNQLGSYSYMAVYDKVTNQNWFVMKKPNDPQHYYWKHIDGADPNRLIQSSTGKLDNGAWAPFQTQNQIQARLGVELANGLANFWAVLLGGSIATNGAFITQAATALLEDALGVPLINSPDDLAKSGSRRQIQGEAYESVLQKKFGGTGKFSAKSNTTSREFDGAYGDIWYEAKSGDFFGSDFSSKNFAKFKSDMGRGLNVTKHHGKNYEVIAEKSIPGNVKEWLDAKGIKYQENVTN